MRGISILAAAALTLSACAMQGEQPAGSSLAQRQQLVREAEAFMAEYARLLLAGDRPGIAALYDRDGAILVRGGVRIPSTHSEIVQRYARRGWQPPAAFEWRDLHYEPAGPQSVVVLGKFLWGDTDGSRSIGTYNALLRRRDGRLFIRIEDEAADQSAS